MIAHTPKPPYYAVVFSSIKSESDEGYGDMANFMVDLAAKQDGFLGIESARQDLGITVSYWRDLDSIRKWKANSDHLVAQKFGRDKWYQAYKTRICLVERDYDFGI